MATAIAAATVMPAATVTPIATTTAISQRHDHQPAPDSWSVDAS